MPVTPTPDLTRLPDFGKTMDIPTTTGGMIVGIILLVAFTCVAIGFMLVAYTHHKHKAHERKMAKHSLY